MSHLNLYATHPTLDDDNLKMMLACSNRKTRRISSLSVHKPDSENFNLTDNIRKDDPPPPKSRQTSYVDDDDVGRRRR